MALLHKIALWVSLRLVQLWEWTGLTLYTANKNKKPRG
jgi:hypothetical protein